MTLSPPRRTYPPAASTVSLTASKRPEKPVSESFAAKIARAGRSLFSHFRRKAPTRAVTLPAFHPIIFANGSDDDTDGVKAFIAGEPVIYAGRLIEGGDCILSGLRLRLRCNALVIDLPNGGQMLLGGNCPPFEVVTVRHFWKRHIRNSEMAFNRPVQP